MIISNGERVEYRIRYKYDKKFKKYHLTYHRESGLLQVTTNIEEIDGEIRELEDIIKDPSIVRHCINVPKKGMPLLDPEKSRLPLFLGWITEIRYN